MEIYKERTKRTIIRLLEKDEIEYDPKIKKYVDCETKKPIYV